MTTDKPEVVAHMSPVFGEVVSQQEYAGWEHDALRNPDTEYGNRYKDKTLEYSEPLIRLSDYETLQAKCRILESELATVKKVAYGNMDLLNECEQLRKDAEFGRSVLSKREPGKVYGCHCDLEEGMEPDGCVIDSGERHNCVYAKDISAKEQCEYWRVIASDAAGFTLGPVSDGGMDPRDRGRES